VKKLRILSKNFFAYVIKARINKFKEVQIKNIAYYRVMIVNFEINIILIEMEGS